jgi:hypothetical protein
LKGGLEETTNGESSALNPSAVCDENLNPFRRKKPAWNPAKHHAFPVGQTPDQLWRGETRLLSQIQ